MNKILLNAREIEKIYKLFNKMCDDCGTIEIEQSENSGIGGILKATVYVTHREVDGDFTVIITDERDW